MRIAYIGNVPPDELEGDNIAITPFDLPKSLTAFVSNPILKDYAQIIFNLMSTRYSSPHILSAMQLLRQYSSAEITIVKEENETTAELFAGMHNFNIRNLVTVKDDTQIWKEISDCISGRKTLQHIAQVRIAGAHAAGIKIANQKLEIPQGMMLNIAVLGALNRIGTTTQAIGIYHFLAQIGFSPVLVDKSGFSEYYRSYEETKIDKNGLLIIHDVRCDTNEHLNDPLINANIFDLGINATHNMTDILSADFVIVVCGTKINEILPLTSLLSELSAIEENRLINIISFCTEQEFNGMNENLGGQSFMAPYHPGMWTENNNFYFDMLLVSLKEVISRL